MKKTFKDQYTAELSQKLIEAEIQPDEGLLHSIGSMLRANRAALLGLILILVILLSSCSIFQKEPDPSELYTPTPGCDKESISIIAITSQIQGGTPHEKISAVF